MDKITPCLWFKDGAAEAAAGFYVSLLPDSRIDRIVASPASTPSTAEGDTVVVEFTLAGRSYMALNGGEFGFAPNMSVSFSVDCDDQAEVDRLWAAILGSGGAEVQCGWITDRWGYPWQIVPRVMTQLLGDPDRAKAKRAMTAMMTMVKLDIAEIEAAAQG